MRLGPDLEVRTGFDRVQERAGRAHPASLRDRTLGVGHAFLNAAIIVRVLRDAVLGRTLDERIAQRMGEIGLGDLQRAVAPAKGVLAQIRTFDPLEIGQHVGIAPAPVAALGPVVIVSGLPPVPDVPVDRGRPAQRLATRSQDRAPARPIGRLHGVEPVDRRHVEGLGEPRRDMDPGVPVTPARLQHADRRARVSTQPVGQDTACRASTDDDVVKRVQGILPCTGMRESGAACKVCRATIAWMMRAASGSRPRAQPAPARR